MFAWALFFVALLGAMFFETRDWVAGAGLALAIPVTGAAYERRGGKMIEGILVAVIVLLLLFFASWGVAIVVSGFLLLIIVSGKLLRMANLFPPFGGVEEDPTNEELEIIARR